MSSAQNRYHCTARYVKGMSAESLTYGFVPSMHYLSLAMYLNCPLSTADFKSLYPPM